MRYIFCLLMMLLFLGACAHSKQSDQISEQQYHKVKPGESMDSIALELNVPYELLRRSNIWLDPVRIKPNMKLLIPTQESIQAYQEAQRKSRQQLVNLNGHIWPLKNISISSAFGPRNGRAHKGIDLRAPLGTPIFATAAGVVIVSGKNGGYGNIIVIDHGYSIHTAYAHNESNLVKKGQRVVQGEVIAKVGMTGKATGPHVHYELRRNGKAINPNQHIETDL